MKRCSGKVHCPSPAARRARRFPPIGLAMMLSLSTASATERFRIDTSGMHGFQVVTAEDGRLKAQDTAIIEYDGPIAYPMAQNLREIWDQLRSAERFSKIVLRLNSPGGADSHGHEAIAVLSEIREQATLITLVDNGDTCASMCVGIFIQGDQRQAGPASSFMFHGASRYMSNIPDRDATGRYFELFHQRAIDPAFIEFLYGSGFALNPGSYWLSGSDLARLSNIVTNLLPNWRPERPVMGLPAMVRGGV